MDKSNKQTIEPKVSIVFTSYNHREYLCQALDSLLCQTFKDFELIIVDDCSTDGSQEVLKTYDDPRIRLFLKDKNSGSYVISSNYGASMARAPYIIFAQCDDWAEPRQLERLVTEMEKHNVGVVFSCSNMVDEKGNCIGTDFEGREPLFKEKNANDNTIRKDEAGQYLTKACVIPNLSAALIKTSVYKELKGLSADYKVLADWDFWLRASLITDFFYIREPLNNFRQHSTTIRSSIKMKKQLSEGFDMLFGYASNIHMPRMKTNQIVCYFWIMWAATGIKEWCASFPYLMKKGMRYSSSFPIAFIQEFIIIAFKKFFCKRL